MDPLAALYMGPDQVTPFGSILAAITGFLLLFWNKFLGVVRRVLGVFRRSHEPETAGKSEKHPPSPA